MVHIEELILAVNKLRDDVAAGKALPDQMAAVDAQIKAIDDFQAFCKQHDLPVDFSLRV